MSIIFYILEYKNQTSPAELYFENQLIRDKISNARIWALLSICFVYLLFIFLFFIINRSSLLPFFFANRSLAANAAAISVQPALYAMAN